MGSSPTSGIGRKAWMFVASKPRPTSARGKRKKKQKKTACAMRMDDRFLRSLCALCSTKHDESTRFCQGISIGELDLHVLFLGLPLCQIRGSIVVSISACHAEDPGSIPGRGVLCPTDCYFPNANSSMRIASSRHQCHTIGHEQNSNASQLAFHR